MTQEIGSFDSRVEKGFLTRCTVMGDTRHHKVSQIISLEVEAVGKSTFLIFRTYFRAYHRIFMCIGVCIDSLILLFDDNGGMNISVLAL